MNRNSRGRKRSTTGHIHRIVYRRIISNCLKLVREMATEIKSEYRITTDAQTIRNRMREAGYRDCVAR